MAVLVPHSLNEPSYWFGVSTEPKPQPETDSDYFVEMDTLTSYRASGGIWIPELTPATKQEVQALAADVAAAADPLKPIP